MILQGIAIMDMTKSPLYTDYPLRDAALLKTMQAQLEAFNLIFI